MVLVGFSPLFFDWSLTEGRSMCFVPVLLITKAMRFSHVVSNSSFFLIDVPCLLLTYPAPPPCRILNVFPCAYCNGHFRAKTNKVFWKAWGLTSLRYKLKYIISGSQGIDLVIFGQFFWYSKVVVLTHYHSLQCLGIPVALHPQQHGLNFCFCFCVWDVVIAYLYTNK